MQVSLCPRKLVPTKINESTVELYAFVQIQGSTINLTFQLHVAYLICASLSPIHVLYTSSKNHS